MVRQMVEVKRTVIGVLIVVVTIIGSFVAWSNHTCGGGLLRVKDTLCHLDGTMPADSAMMAEIAVYRDSIRENMSEVLCESESVLDAIRPESGEMRVLSDAMFEETRLYAKEHKLPEPDFAMVNVGGIRTILPQGKVTIGDVFQVAPFENYAVVVEVDSAVIRSIMEHVRMRGGEALSGCQVHLNRDSAWNVLIGGKPLEGGRKYHLATLDYLADGGDSFELMVGLERYETNLLFREMLRCNFTKLGKRGGVLRDPKDRRIISE